MTVLAETGAAETDAAPATGRHDLLRQVLRGRGLAGLVLVVTVVVLGLLAPVLAPYAPNHQLADADLLGPSSTHWLGTDQVSRDIWSRTLYGIRVDLLVVFLAVPLGAVVGSLVGLVGTVWESADTLAQRLFDLVLAFPSLILAIALTALLGAGLATVAVVIVVAEIPVFGRMVRSSALLVRETPYVEAARVVGASRWWVLRKHVLPNSLEPVVVQLALSMSVAVFIEGAMSFLGIGVRPPDPSLGSLVKDGVRAVYEAPTFAVGPLLVIAALVLGFLLLAQSLSSARATR